MAELTKRIDFVYIFDVQDGNPNGDPDAGNLPRVDVETGVGLVTDVCLKRKIRNYVDIAKSGNPHFDIFIREAAVLDTLVNDAYEAPEVKNADKNKAKDKAQKALCNRYYDIRAFGAVIATSKNKAKYVVQFSLPLHVPSTPLYARATQSHAWPSPKKTRTAIKPWDARQQFPTVYILLTDLFRSILQNRPASTPKTSTCFGLHC